MEYQDTASTIDTKFAFTEAELKVVRDALKTKLYNKEEDVEVRQAKWQTLVAQLSSAFGIPTVTLRFIRDDEPGAATYNPRDHSIYMGTRFSLTTLFHSFFIAILSHKKEDTAFREMLELAEFSSLKEAAEAFALSLFKAAAPVMYDAAKIGGKLLYFQELEQAGHGPRQRDPDAPAFEEQEDAEPAPGRAPDIDPENRIDRGNGAGED